MIIEIVKENAEFYLVKTFPMASNRVYEITELIYFAMHPEDQE